MTSFSGRLFGGRRRLGRAGQALHFTLSLEQLQDRIAPALFTVANLNDSGAGSLRQAILDANAASGSDTIQFSAVTGTITLTTGVLNITDGVTITGPGAANLTVSGNNVSAVFATATSGTVSMSGMTIAGGQATYGGGISNQAATLSLSNVAFTGNTATAGGAILNWDGFVVNAQNCTFTSNIANGASAGGGGIWNNNGGVALTNCTFTSNSATDTQGAGGAIFNTSGGSLSVSGTTFTTNSAGQAAGAVMNQGRADFFGCAFNTNNANLFNPASGGAFVNYFTGAASLRDSSFAGNSANAYGGGIYNSFGGAGGQLALLNSTVNGNSAGQFGGGLLNDTGGVVAIVNSTFNANSAGQYGGGVLNILDATLAIAASTIAGNNASNGGGVWNDSNDFALQNTIVVGNTLPSSSTADNIRGFGTTNPISRNNVIGANGTGGLTNGVNGNQVGVSVAAVNLAPLASNGGSTQTMALQSGSVALNAGNVNLTTLAKPLLGSSTALTVSDATYVGIGEVVQIDSEQLRVIGLTGANATVIRALNGTTAVSHAAGVSVLLPFDQRGSHRYPGLGVDVGAYQSSPPFSIITLLPDWTVNRAYSQTVATVSGAGASTFQVTTGALPAGLALNQTTGAITGSPTAVGTTAFTITATDTNSATTQKNYSIVIHAAPAITTATLPDPSLNQAYLQTIATSGGTAPVAFSLTGNLPSGLTLAADTGILSGSPTKPGDFTFTVTATDAAGATAAQAYTVHVHETLIGQAPLGSQIRAGKLTDHITASQSNTYRIDLAAGQTLSLVLRTAAGLQGTLQVRDPSNQLIASGSAASAGARVLLQNVAATTSGVYTITVAGAGGTAGDFALTVDLNGQQEAESASTPSNDTLATAENIDGSFSSVTAEAARGAVISGNTYAVAAATPTFQDISLTGTVSTAAAGDDVADTLTSAQLGGFTFPFFGATYSSLSFSSNGLITFGSANTSFTNGDLASPVAAPSQASIAALWTDLLVDGTGTGVSSRNVFWQVIGSGPTQQLIIQWNNVRLFTDANTFSFQAVLTADGTIQLNYGSGLPANAISNSTVGIKDAGLGNQANIVVNLNGTQPLGTFVAATQSVRFSPSSTGVDYYALTLTAGDVVSASATPSASGNVSVDLRNGSDSVLASGVAGHSNVASLVDRFTVPSSGVYYLRVTGDSKVPYNLVVGRNAALDAEANDSTATPQDITGTQAVIGAIEAGSTSNGYVATSPAYGFADISGSSGGGTIITAFNYDITNSLANDDNSTEIPLGFAFPFYGSTHTTVWVSTNGLLSFGQPADNSDPNGALMSDPAEAVIAPYWDDFVIAGHADSHVYYKLVGSGATQQFIVQWNDVSYFADYSGNGGLGGITFQAILGIDGSIRLNFRSLSNGNNNGTADEGLSATTGIKDAGTQGPNRLVLIGNVGQVPDANSPVRTGKSVLITPNSGPDWYTVTLGANQSILQLSTTTPGDNASQWANTLNPKIDLYDSTNTLVASGTAGADGRNELLIATGLTPNATYKIRVIGEGSTGEYVLRALARPAPAIVSVTVNGGAIAARDRFGLPLALAQQQSVVEQLLVTFNQPVTLDAGAFNIGSLAAAVTASVAIPSTASVAVTTTPVASSGDAVAGYTQYIVTFGAGAGVNSIDNSQSGGLGNAFTTIKDGFYQLNSVGSKIHVASATAVDGADKFWALYGAVPPADITTSAPLGDGNDKLLVDGVALSAMYATFGSFSNVAGPPSYVTAFDANLDGIVDGIDLSKMYANFGTIWTF